MNSRVLTCGTCGRVLPPNHVGACPAPGCGSTDKIFSIVTSDEVRITDKTSWELRKEYIQKHLGFLIPAVVATFGAPFLGLWLAGWSGVLVGLVCSGVAFWLSFRGLTHTVEKTRGSDA